MKICCDDPYRGLRFSGPQPPEVVVLYDCDTAIGPATMVWVLVLN